MPNLCTPHRGVMRYNSLFIVVDNTKCFFYWKDIQEREICKTYRGRYTENQLAVMTLSTTYYHLLAAFGNTIPFLMAMRNASRIASEKVLRPLGTCTEEFCSIISAVKLQILDVWIQPLVYGVYSVYSVYSVYGVYSVCI